MITTKGSHRALSARGRIIGAMVVLLTAAFGASLMWSAQVLSSKTDALVADRLTHAAASFRAFSVSPSGRYQNTVDELLTRYMQDTATYPMEAQFSLLDGAPHRRTQGDPPVRLDLDTDFLAQLADQTNPTHGTLNTAAGEAAYAAIPVSVVGDPHSGTLVYIQFRSALSAPLYSSLGIFAIASVLAVVGAALAAWFIAGRVLFPVRLVREAAESITETDLRGRIEVVGRDDVAALATFNRMLDRLETAFTTQQQFVDDAGHELRTPITVVRGQLEMMGDSPEERNETIALVMDELDRMSRIVNDLLLLAKAEQPDFIVRDEVEVMDLLVDTLAKARMLGPHHWVIDELAEGPVLADGQRITQALMQLATNAAAHTPADGTIGMGSRMLADSLVLWVRDTGSGMSESEQDGIFERFRRGAGRRTSPGAGLGLSIVNSIVDAHGGKVRVQSVKGAGSTFEISLPLLRPEGIAELDPS